MNLKVISVCEKCVRNYYQRTVFVHFYIQRHFFPRGKHSDASPPENRMASTQDILDRNHTKLKDSGWDGKPIYAQ